MRRATLPVTPAAQLDQRAAAQAWLVDQLWGEEAVGILGGEPKCCKSLFALHLALAVASGRPMLERYAVSAPGPVLFYAAEDAEHIVADRIRRIAAGAGVTLTNLPLAFITTPTLRLDSQSDLDALDATVAQEKPRLLVLDPFVRLHRKDENQAGDIAPILAALRAIQRQHHCAILVAHHARKGGGNVRAGQALRGSSEFHAWGDCNCFLRWRQRELILSVEHRAAPPPDDLVLALRQNDDSLQIHIVDHAAAPTATSTPAPTPAARILACLQASPVPLTREQLRQAVGMRNQTIGQVLNDLCARRQIVRRDHGYHLNPVAA